MATGRTISASFLTPFDQKVMLLCEDISQALLNSIPDTKSQREFYKEYGKISESRDGGLGLGGGKLQRDAICTRGRQGKAPYSNRNLRWHPLVVAQNMISYAKEIERIEIDGEDEQQTLIFVIKTSEGIIKKYSSERVHELPHRYVALPKHWLPHIEKLKTWNDTQWTQNSCVIPAYEACEWFQSVETYATLGIAIASGLFGAKLENIFQKIVEILKKQSVDTKIKLPSSQFPIDITEITLCPVCKQSISSNLEGFRKEKRQETWQPAWRTSKKDEGEDASIQIMHVVPLIESKIRHTPKNVRYGHRWCNVAMTDHSLDETLDFMEFVLRAHQRLKK
ncbi:MAG: hypothetical protein QXH80_04780 [Candidatus Nanoarchaeia archaeon]